MFRRGGGFFSVHPSSMKWGFRPQNPWRRDRSPRRSAASTCRCSIRSSSGSTYRKTQKCRTFFFVYFDASRRGERKRTRPDAKRQLYIHISGSCCSNSPSRSRRVRHWGGFDDQMRVAPYPRLYASPFFLPPDCFRGVLLFVAASCVCVCVAYRARDAILRSPAPARAPLPPLNFRPPDTHRKKQKPRLMRNLNTGSRKRRSRDPRPHPSTRFPPPIPSNKHFPLQQTERGKEWAGTKSWSGTSEFGRQSLLISSRDLRLFGLTRVAGWGSEWGDFCSPYRRSPDTGRAS